MGAQTDVEVHHLLDIARRQAVAAGLGADDADDCACLFLEKASPFEQHPPSSDAWLHRCARNHALNFQRDRRRLLRHEDPCHALPGAARGAAPDLDALPGDALDPQAVMARAECWRHIMQSLLLLDPLLRELFLRRCLYGESVASLAVDTGKSCEAVRKIVNRAGRHLRASLERSGWSQADVCLCLAPPP